MNFLYKNEYRLFTSVEITIRKGLSKVYFTFHPAKQLVSLSCSCHQEKSLMLTTSNAFEYEFEVLIIFS
jgi:hypothetical protein